MVEDEQRRGTFSLVGQREDAAAGSGGASGNGKSASTSKTSTSSSSVFFDDGYTKTNLTKWDLLRGMKYYTFRFDKFYHKQDAEAFAKDFFSSPDVQREVLKLGGGSSSNDSGSGNSISMECESVKVKPLRASVTNMGFFDKLLECEDVVRSNGQLVKCMDDYHQGFHVQDRLRDVLLNEDNEFELDHGELFTEEEKEEFIYHIFKHLAIGGSLCQFEDKLGPYLDLAKTIYKELATVWRNPRTSKVEVASGVYSVMDVTFKDKDRPSGSLFEEESIQNWFYISTDPFRRTCKVWVHKFQHHW